jgi:hypothetical protein
MKTKFLPLISLGVFGFVGCTEQSAQMQALAAAAEKKATEATLNAERYKIENEQLKAENTRLESELAAASTAGSEASSGGSPGALPKAEITDKLEYDLYKTTREFKASLEQALDGYSGIRVSDAPTIQVAEAVSSPYSMPLGLTATDPDGKQIFAEFEAKADWEGNWTIPPVDEVLKGAQTGDPKVATTSGTANASGTPGAPATGRPEPPAGTGEVASNVPNPQPGNPAPTPTPDTPSPPKPAPPAAAPRPSFLQGKQLQGSAKVDWSRAVE